MRACISDRFQAPLLCTKASRQNARGVCARVSHRLSVTSSTAERLHQQRRRERAKLQLCPAAAVRACICDRSQAPLLCTEASRQNARGICTRTPRCLSDSSNCSCHADLRYPTVGIGSLPKQCTPRAPVGGTGCRNWNRSCPAAPLAKCNTRCWSAVVASRWWALAAPGRRASVHSVEGERSVTCAMVREWSSTSTMQHATRLPPAALQHREFPNVCVCLVQHRPRRIVGRN